MLYAIQISRSPENLIHGRSHASRRNGDVPGYQSIQKMYVNKDQVQCEAHKAERLIYRVVVRRNKYQYRCRIPRQLDVSQSSAKTAETRHSEGHELHFWCRCEEILGFRLRAMKAMEALGIEPG